MSVAMAADDGISIKRIDDPRARFYLDNYKIIETWAQLRAEAGDALQDLLTDLASVLTTDAMERGENDLTVRADESQGRKHCIVLSRRSWQDLSGHPSAAVVIEWYNPIINKDGEVHLYVGVRTWPDGAGAKLAADLCELAPIWRSKLGRSWEREAGGYPVWRWIVVEDDSIDEIYLAGQARHAAWQCWDTTALQIDAAVQSVNVRAQEMLDCPLSTDS